jgi:3-oxoacyl-(acyl-carrier-protein) synthase
MEKITKAIEEAVEFISFGKIKLCICVNTKECKSTKCCKKEK